MRREVPDLAHAVYFLCGPNKLVDDLSALSMRLGEDGVLNLLKRGALELSNWGAPNLFSHVIWGSLFAKIFGFSFTVLRFSTLCLGLVSILSFYEIFRELKLPPRMGVHAALVLAGSPLFLLLSNTYMSDVSYCAFGLLACLFLIKAL